MSGTVFIPFGRIHRILPWCQKVIIRQVIELRRRLYTDSVVMILGISSASTDINTYILGNYTKSKIYKEHPAIRNTSHVFGHCRTEDWGPQHGQWSSFPYVFKWTTVPYKTHYQTVLLRLGRWLCLQHFVGYARVYMSVCLYICIYACIYECTYAHMYVWMLVGCSSNLVIPQIWLNLEVLLPWAHPTGTKYFSHLRNLFPISFDRLSRHLKTSLFSQSWTSPYLGWQKAETLWGV